MCLIVREFIVLNESTGFGRGNFFIQPFGFLCELRMGKECWCAGIPGLFVLIRRYGIIKEGVLTPADVPCGRKNYQSKMMDFSVIAR